MKRLVAIALLLAMCVTLLPLSLAEETNTTEPLAYGAEGEAVTLIQQLLGKRGQKTAENIACAKMHPRGVVGGGGFHGLAVKLGQLIALFGKDRAVFPQGRI